MSLVRKIINTQIAWSHAFDRLLPDRFRIDGNQNYLTDVLPRYIKPNAVIYDVGGGKNPFLNAVKKAGINAKVIVVDIDQDELGLAPAGTYDELVCADITKYQGRGDGDLVICQSLMEHVRDTNAAIKSMALILKPGGRAVIFVPSRYAVFAMLNRMLPEGLKRKILYSIFPHTERDQGFPAFYNRCSAPQFAAMARAHGCEVINERLYYSSGYFAFFFPLHFIWRLWLLVFYVVSPRYAAETFSMVIEKRS